MGATHVHRRPSTGADRIVDGLWRIRLGPVSAYLVESDDSLVLVDCGEARHPDRIAAAVATLGHDIDALRHILVTHHHPDHSGGLAQLARRTGAAVHAHAADAVFVRGTLTWPGYNRAAIAGKLIGPLLVRMNPGRPEPWHVDRELRDGQRLALAGGIEVVHTPGHTPGHAAFLLHRQGALIVGDAASNIGRLRPASHWLAASVTDDGATARSSFGRLADLDFEVAVFGHGSPILSGAARRFRETDRRLRRRTGPPR